MATRAQLQIRFPEGIALESFETISEKMEEKGHLYEEGWELIFGKDWAHVGLQFDTTEALLAFISILPDTDLEIS